MGKTKKMDERLDSEKNSYSHILKYTGLFGGVQGAEYARWHSQE